jgi:hypothetical protein
MLEHVYQQGINKDQQRKIQPFEKIMTVSQVKHFRLDDIV